MEALIKKACAALKAHRKVMTQTDLANVADLLSEATKDLMRAVSARDTVLADLVDGCLHEAENCVKRVVLAVPDKLADLAEEILSIEEGYYPEGGEDDAIMTFTVRFDKHIEADIKLCNGDTPWVDAVLFYDGSEIGVLDPGDELLGEFYFEYNDVDYIAVLIRESEAEQC